MGSRNVRVDGQKRDGPLVAESCPSIPCFSDGLNDRYPPKADIGLIVRPQLLPNEAEVFDRRFEIAAEGVDVDATATVVTRING